jgi:hypothetical protein
MNGALAFALPLRRQGIDFTMTIVPALSRSSLEVLMRAALFEYARRCGFCDPLSACVPRSETNLTGLLSFYAQRQAIAWERVALYDCDTFNRMASAADMITHPGAFLSEYVLPSRDEREESIWGSMPADLLYISANLATVVMFENKIGGSIGYDRGPEKNQFARQIDYLVNLRTGKVKRAAFILISTRQMLDAQWYRRELSQSLLYNERYTTVPGYLMTWEDVCDATTV